MISVALATEDELSEAVGLRLLSELSVEISVDLLLRKGGFGYLRSRMSNWRELCKCQPVVILTDLDKTECPSRLLLDWAGSTPLPENMLLRIAVREVEAWLLADHDAIRQLVGKKGNLQSSPDDLLDPKQCLIALAKNAPRDVRLDLIKADQAIASQGIGYNSRLVSFVNNEWNPERAAQRSPSLARARRRLRELAARQ